LCIEGVRLGPFEVGREYEVGNSLGSLFLAEGWAEPVPLLDPDMLILSLKRKGPPNLMRIYPPYYEDELAHDKPPRKYRKRSGTR
jgi:hypothetical protein